jgi:DNA gyrase subunit B
MRSLENDFAGPFVLGENGTSENIASRAELLERVTAMAKKDLAIQRYKGLGEMNPEQLWETTLDINARSLLQVKVKEGDEADDLFTKLMGDEVEPRRLFIQQNALSASVDV